MKLFPRSEVVGIFRGFSEGGLEFHADLVLPYKNEFQSAPMHGQFVIVQLETEDEGVLGRITSISSQGRLTSSAGEDYGLRAIADERAIPEDLREQYLKYLVDIRVLGVLKLVNQKLVFAASHRRLPHVGSKVALLADDVLQEVSGHNLDGAEIGHLALGEFIFAKDDSRLKKEDWMQTIGPRVVPRFNVSDLVSRRSFVFARAGFGKSNLVKLLFSNLYKETPFVEKRGDTKVPVGTVIFDPEGEYFWPDNKNRPGLCDVPHLKDKLVVFTRKQGPSSFYQSFVASDIKLDIRRLRPSDVISIALPPDKQEQQNVHRLKQLNDSSWRRLVDEIYRNRNAADGNLIKELLRLESGQDEVMLAARANMTTIVTMLHDPSSQMMDMMFAALKEGKICVVDVSQLRGTPGLILSGIILQRIFDHNQDEFTKAKPEAIPTIAVVEEAQSVLGNAGSSGEGPYITWVKEGRKYDLGAVLITQQPGSISPEILSQGDNWFVFHLLSSGDLQAVKRANAHFSDDILSTLLNEPIRGHGVYWSSAAGKSYPIPVRVLSFEALYQPIDPTYSHSEADTVAREIRRRFEHAIQESQISASPQGKSENLDVHEPLPVAGDVHSDEAPDAFETYVLSAIQKLKVDTSTINKLKTQGMPWKGIQVKLVESLPDVISDRDQFAYSIVSRAMNSIFGEGRWDTERRPSKSGSGTTSWIVVKNPTAEA
jgi:hypothetical protein